jgi:allantoicase
VAGVKDLIDLASERLGGSVMAANDEFFAPKERLILAADPVWREHEYTDRGKWMDGWETRRRRDVLPGEPAYDIAHDWCLLKLAARGAVRRIDVETTFFKGNFPQSCSVEVCDRPQATTMYDLHRANWQPVVERTGLRGDARNEFDIVRTPATHVRLNIFPDGGVARLRVFGEVMPDWSALGSGEIDLASVLHGGHVVESSDMFFGSRNNLIMPGAPRSMADGWETRRRRTPGHDWTIVRLGQPGAITRVELDTRFFKGNAPAACSLDATTSDAAGDWVELLPKKPLQPDKRHTFDTALKRMRGVTHVRLNIFPDGGVARLQIFGTLG